MVERDLQPGDGERSKFDLPVAEIDCVFFGCDEPASSKIAPCAEENLEIVAIIGMMVSKRDLGC